MTSNRRNGDAMASRKSKSGKPKAGKKKPARRSGRKAASVALGEPPEALRAYRFRPDGRPIFTATPAVAGAKTMAAAAFAPPPGISRIEVDRVALRNLARTEVASRMDTYFSALEKAERQAPARAAAKGAGAPELRIVAEGDSWFDYPWFLLSGGGIIPRLAEALGPDLFDGTILNLAHYGDTVEQMLGVSQRQTLVRALKKGDFQAILFSGGGNDVAGDQVALWVNERASNPDPAQALRDDVFENILGIVRRGYEDLVEIRDQHAPDAVIFTHAYCVPFPGDHGVCGVGPWLYPSFMLRGWRDPNEQRSIVRTMLQRFSDQLKGLAAKPESKIVHVDTLAINLPSQNWANEIHPDGEGFDEVTQAFAKAIRSRFNLP